MVSAEEEVIMEKVKPKKKTGKKVVAKGSAAKKTKGIKR
jgi:hypothetical protein